MASKQVAVLNHLKLSPGSV